jgi:alkylation response protein AidB-like acyl-CoA dehydrogenase
LSRDKETPMPNTDTLEEFRDRCKHWLAANLPTREHERALPEQSRAARMGRARERQAALYDAGLAGLTFPVEFGGQGLSRRHQEVLNEESDGYAMPSVLGVPSIGVLGATLLDCGDDEQRRAHLPRILRGDEVWVQLLSEPTGGSDLAGVRMRADRDGDIWRLNGSKMWTSNVRHADWGLCLTRTDWSVPKHEGLTMFMVPLDADGIEVVDIALATGRSDFCQEFFDDVEVPTDHVVGAIGAGWSVASRLLVHERDTVGGNSMYARPQDGGFGDDTGISDLVRTAQESARGPEQLAYLVDAIVTDHAHRALVTRVTELISSGQLPPVAGALLKLSSGLRGNAVDDAALWLGGAATVFGANPREQGFAERYLVRQAMCLAGGSNEMQRNLISERVLGLPRELRPDLGRPFSEVRSS